MGRKKPETAFPGGCAKPLGPPRGEAPAAPPKQRCPYSQDSEKG